MKTKNTAWTAEEEKALAEAVEGKISPARLSIRLNRSEASIKRRMRELGLMGKSRKLRTPLPAAQIDIRARAMEWLGACQSRDLIRLMDIYKPDATLECGCVGSAAYVGLGAIQQYWAPKLSAAHAKAFALDQLRVEDERIVIDYLSFEAKPVRMYLAFDKTGQIIRSECGPRGCTLLAA